MHRPSRRLTIFLACAACAAAGAIAQEPPAYPAPQYPSQQYPSQQYPSQQPYTPPIQGDNRKGRMRQFFATTLAAILQGSGTTSAVGLSDVVVGGIADWFDRRDRRKQQRKQAKAMAAAQAAGQTNYQDGQYPPAQAGAPAYAPPADAGSPAYAPAQEYPPPQYSPPQYAPDPAQQYAPVQYYDAQSGEASAAPAYAPAYSPAPAYADAAQAAPADTLYAGIAYEIHALRPDGSSIPVNPATHEFYTGDQFVVLYRPTLPGRMRVVNVNPAGRETEIDTVDVAAAQLMRLGPYRFEAMRGDESLRFTITPCSSQALYVATRDIVKVDAGAASAGGLNLGNCNNVATRSIRGPATRDIRKVAVEGDTGFAFDPVSQQELASGQIAPREFTVMFRHR
jgi:hypothetical protein